MNRTKSKLNQDFLFYIYLKKRLLRLKSSASHFTVHQPYNHNDISWIRRQAQSDQIENVYLMRLTFNRETGLYIRLKGFAFWHWMQSVARWSPFHF